MSDLDITLFISTSLTGKNLSDLRIAILADDCNLEWVNYFMAEFRKCKILCWDQHQLLPGTTRDLQFTYACEEADYIFVLLSFESVQKENLFQKLIKKALSATEEKPEGSIKIIPIRLDNCEIPSSLREFYHVDLWEKNVMLRLVIAMENEWKRRTEANDWKSISYKCLWE